MNANKQAGTNWRRIWVGALVFSMALLYIYNLEHFTSSLRQGGNSDKTTPSKENAYHHNHGNLTTTIPSSEFITGGDIGEISQGGSEEEDDSDASNKKVLKVCTVALNKRQGSIFRTNLLSLYGSGRVTYAVTRPERCPWNRPRVRMIPFVKCCTTQSMVRKTIGNSVNLYDIIIVTGDEYCMLDDARAHYRQYHHDDFLHKRTVDIQTKGGEVDVVPLPLFMPLGPRSEFVRVTENDRKSALHRKYLFNFMGSLSSPSRKRLKRLFSSTEPTSLTNYIQNGDAFIHTAERWRQSIKTSNGYVTPDVYRAILLDSKFTLCPLGHNPEAYRIYESCEAGSIPILINDGEFYNNHPCKNAYQPFMNSNAPFIWLKSWEDLGEFLVRVEGNTTFIEEKQRQVVKWYESYMKEFALQFEQLLLWRFNKRMNRKMKPDQTALQEEENDIHFEEELFEKFATEINNDKRII